MDERFQPTVYRPEHPFPFVCFVCSEKSSHGALQPMISVEATLDQAEFEKAEKGAEGWMVDLKRTQHLGLC